MRSKSQLSCSVAINLEAIASKCFALIFLRVLLWRQAEADKISDAQHPAVIHPQPLSSQLLQEAGDMNNSALQKRPRIRMAPGAYAILRTEILEHDGWRCQKCGCSKNLDVHHATRRSALGDDAETNLITLCRACHQILHGSSSSLPTAG
jgi:HNH endonuclease